MFDQVALRLLEGAFICEASAPSLFRWLDAETNRLEIDSYLHKIGRQLAETPNGSAFYATWQRVGADERAEAKRVMANIKQTIRPVVEFIKLCMNSQSVDVAPSPGDRVDYSQLLGAVTGNPQLQENLRAFSAFGKDFAVTDASPKGMLDRVVSQMEKAGYFILFNKEQMAYRFTGKLDYFYQVIEFLGENESDIKLDELDELSEEVAPETGRLI